MDDSYGTIQIPFYVVQTYIAIPAKHLQALMMLWLNKGASFLTEGNGNMGGNQLKSTTEIAASRYAGYKSIVWFKNILSYLAQGGSSVESYLLRLSVKAEDGNGR